MSHEYYNIVIGGEGVRRRSNGINAEKITFFNNFVRVSKGLLSTIVAQFVNDEYYPVFIWSGKGSFPPRPEKRQGISGKVRDLYGSGEKWHIYTVVQR